MNGPLSSIATAKRSLVIIGGGASGAICLLQCRSMLPSSVRITLVGEDARIGRGRAYGEANQDHLLNVPAAKMSADLERPSDFLNWLSTSHPEATQQRNWPYVPRAWFGSYLEDKIAALDVGAFEHVRDSLDALSRGMGHWNLKLKSGASLTADYVIVASGYQERVDESYLHATDAKVLSSVLQPYDESGFSSVQADERVLIVGTGLTAVDTYFRLKKQGVQNIQFLSRTGKFPLTHETAVHLQSTVHVPNLVGMSPLQIFRVVRSLGMNRSDWIAIADQVRMQAQKLWSAWSVEERSQFFRHLRPRWELIRHRLPVCHGQDLEKLCSEGSITLHSGDIRRTERSGKGLVVSFLDWKSSEQKTLQVEKVVLCAGYGVSRSFSHRPVLDGLRDCSLGLGMINDSAPHLWLAGPCSKASFWEITAIPEIVEQAHLIAEQVADDVEKNHAVNLLSAHSLQTEESYPHHFRFAVRASWGLMGQAVRLMIHGVLPFLFTDSVSNNIRYFALKLTKRRVKSAKSRARTRGTNSKVLSPEQTQTFQNTRAS